MDLHLDPQLPELTPAQALTGWRRELCIELLGDGRARVFMRLLHAPSHKAAELQHGVLFHRVGAGFQDLPGCMEAAGDALRRLVASAQRQLPCRENLFVAVIHDAQAWEAVTDAVDRWQRRPHAMATLRAPTLAAPPRDTRPSLRQLPILGRPAARTQPGLR
ncbi:hypothetical protein [Roseateles sp. BYS87W]|uniref:Diguanylate cyclase n=1 Tax=Pelomonas baiyunensis TaxID=3299026 RepID=A0ABW7GUZ8_9BURK